MLAVLFVGVGCMGRDAGTFRTWYERAHNTRIKEIDEAFKRGDISEFQRQQLKNEASRINGRR